MKPFYLYFFILFYSFSSFANKDSIVSFSTAVKKNIKQYISYSNKAYSKKDYIKATYLYDSLVSNTLIGTQFDDFSFKRIGKKKLHLSSIKIPTLIFTYASWCVIEKGEIPALNKMAQDYKGKIKIVVIFWDKKQNMKKIARKFNSQIEVCYAHESYSKDQATIKLLKKTLGFPTSYYLDASRTVVSIKKRSSKPLYKIDFKTSFDNSITALNTDINSLLIANSLNKTRLATH
ncbi:redoxin domain-containing protein [Flavobacterium sp. HXWNR29]|jgi:thiol-disulfide isomerase/thioredoxin|uniref:TlpA family protein disulfide reductase n=1 Tax=Flavobacterium odoriferum TaxID=2946604 RepID=UPI0021CB1229|nr:redoxin domain-containing protein [Flavobacterium sp. HXWNR29]MCU4188582.1 redoxin domain-containing protein [Flavobacterium sp. HXWNR29]